VPDTVPDTNEPDTYGTEDLSSIFLYIIIAVVGIVIVIIGLNYSNKKTTPSQKLPFQRLPSQKFI